MRRASIKEEWASLECNYNTSMQFYFIFFSFQLYLFDKSTSTWVERGRGQLRLNDLRPNLTSGDENQGPTSRLIMRTAGSLRVILNSKIFPGMTVEKPTEKNVRLTAMDDQVCSM